MVAQLRRIADSTRFNGFITFVIFFAAALVGVETSFAFAAEHHGILSLLDKLVVGIFTVEVLIKVGAEGKRPWRYFHDGWNVFDFVIVAAVYLPVSSQYVTVLRLVRVLRVLKLVRALPRLQIIVGALIKSIPSMGYITVLLLMMFYVYGVTGVFLFSENDPVRFGSLSSSFLTLFRAVTLEDWTDVMYTQMYGCDVYGYGMFEDKCVSPDPSPVATVIYFVSFVLFGTMIMLNLFVGVIMSGMNEASAEATLAARQAQTGHTPDLEEEIEHLRAQIANLDAGLNSISVRARRQDAELLQLRSVPPPPHPRPESSGT